MMRPPKYLLVTAFGVAWLTACDPPGDPSAKGGPTGSPSGAAGPGVGASAQAISRAVITMDDGHDVTKKDGVAYSIPPSKELVLDLGDYRYPALDAAGFGEANAVHVVHGSSGYYRATWAGKGRVTLNAVSLEAVKGGPFEGFEAGEQYIVAVGAEAPAADGALKFAPAWTTKVAVTSR